MFLSGTPSQAGPILEEETNPLMELLMYGEFHVDDVEPSATATSDVQPQINVTQVDASNERPKRERKRRRQSSIYNYY